ncbi:hypothetical protein [Alloprevotella sp. Lung230]|uniref:hypothetical protein n=1 Tax=Alloprevotella sp. Lung230 TaxID=2766595 RepID=UPI001655286D|nr:hypothetical protein [Alloprevotella sp. Lung230]MBC8626071.1 hypothetical protein [Alloprevotella sp. Lung230]
MYSHFSHLRWYCLLLLSAVATIASGQGCPGLSKGDFTVEFDAGNTTCNQPGVVHISYRNAVRGFTKLTYQFSTDRDTYPLAQDALPSERVSVPLDNHWSEGTPIYIRVLAECPGQRVPQSVGLDKLTYTELTASHPQIVATTQSSNGCTGKQGVIRARIGGVTGFSKASYSLYKGTTLARTLFSAKPANYVEFTGLAAGTYRLVAKLTPSCTIGTPPTAPAGATWSGGELTIEKEVVVDVFTLYAYGYPVVGTCLGQVSAGVSRANGITSMTYEVLPRGGGAPLATETVTAPTPNLGKIFGALPAGDYTLHATANCGSAELSADFTVGTVEIGTLNAWVMRQPLPTCGGGSIQAYLPGVTLTAPATFRLLDASNSLVETLTTTDTYAKSGGSVYFKNLAEGKYTVEAEMCGSPVQRKEVELKAQAQLYMNAQTYAKGICAGSGGGEFRINFYPPLDQSGQLEVFYAGSLIRTMQVASGWQETKLTGLPAGDYKARLTLACGEVIETEAELRADNVQYSVSAQQNFGERFCTGYFITFTSYTNKPEIRQLFLDGRYEIKQGSTVVASGLYSTYDEKVGVQVPAPGKYTVRLIASCGTVSMKAEVEVKKPTLKVSAYESTAPSPCESDGAGTISVQLEGVTVSNRAALSELFSWNIEKDGAPYTPNYTGSTQVGASFSIALKRLPVGTYKVTVSPKCNPSMKEEQTFTVSSKTKLQDGFKIIPACGNLTLGGLEYAYVRFPQGVNLAIVKVFNKDTGVEIYSDKKKDPGSYNLELKNKLPVGNYRLEVQPYGYCPSYPLFTYDFTIPNQTEPFQNVDYNSGEGSSWNSPLIKGTAPCANTGSLQVGLRDDWNTLPAVVSSVKFSLTPEGGGTTQTQTMNSKKGYVKFLNLAAGDYKLNMLVDGADCFKTLKITIPTHLEDIPVLAAVDPVVNECPRQRGATFKIEGNNSYVQSNPKICKVWMWDDATKQYVEQLSQTIPAGQFETYFPNIPNYTGTQASNDPWNMPFGVAWPYMLTVDMCGKTIYKTYASSRSGGAPVAKITHTDVTLAKQGTITVRALTTQQNNPNYFYPIGQKDKIEWTVTNTAGTETFTKTVKATDSYTFTGIPEGTYNITGVYKVDQCETTYPLNMGWPVTPTVIKPGTVLAKITGVNGDCDANAQLKLALQDPTGVTKVTYFVKNTKTGTETVISTTTPAVEKVITGLDAATYNIRVESEVPTGATLTTYTDNVSVTLTTSSPYMTIVQDVLRTRSSFKNCRTGYLAFRFQNDNATYYHDMPKFINDEYHFRITAAPAGVTVPQDFALSHPWYSTSWGSDKYGFNITPMRNLPAGKYKIEVTNRCKTALIDCEIPEIDKIPDFDRHNNNCALSSLRFQPSNDGKYYANPWGVLYDPYPYGYSNTLWDDLLTFDFHSTTGAVLSNVPYVNKNYNGNYSSSSLTSVYNFRPWTLDKITVKANACSSIPDVEYPLTYGACGESYCGDLIISYDLSAYEGVENLTLIFEEQPTYNYNHITGKYTRVPGAEIRRVPNYKGGVYNFGSISRSVYVRVVTADGHNIVEQSWTPQNSTPYISQWFGTTYCDGYKIYARASKECQRKAYLLLQKDDASHTLIERSPMLFDNEIWHPNTRLQYGENYVLVMTDEYGTQQTTKKVTLATSSFVAGYKFSNYCDRPNSSCTNDGKGNNICTYTPDYVELVPPTGYGKQGNKPGSPTINGNWYIPADVVFTLVQGGRTYTGVFENIDNWNDVNGDRNSSVYWEYTTDASGYYTYHEPHMRLKWTYEEGGVTYVETPRLDIGVSFTATATSPTCGTLSVPGTTSLRGTIYVDGAGYWQQTCTGWNYNPPSSVSYKDASGNTRTYSVYQYRGDSGWTNIWTPYVVPKTSGRIQLQLKGSYECDMYLQDTPVYKDHYVKASESVSYFCSSSNKGQIYVAATSGNPPYRFDLLDGDEESSPVVMTKTSPNESPVLFEYGDVGKKYRINVYDKCNNLRIAYHTTVVSTGDLAYQLSGKKEFCAEENMDLVGQYIPGATYTWTLPDGSSRSGQTLYLGPARTALAGRYTIDILPPNCASHITSTYDVTVKGITQPAWFAPSQTICQGNPVTYAPGPSIVETKTPTTTTPGTPKYQWQMAVGTGEFTDIAGATHESYTYPADMAGTYRFRRMTTYVGCSTQTSVAQLTVQPGPSQSPSLDELNVSVRKGAQFTLTAGYTQTGGVPVDYKWERSPDGVTWTTVGTSELYTETSKFKQRKMYYRRTIAPQSGIGCQSVTPTITVTFKGGSAARINPHLRLRVPE